jgi:hypothetical protein
MLQLTRTGSVPIRIGFVSASVIRCGNAAACWWSTPDLMTAELVAADPGDDVVILRTFPQPAPNGLQCLQPRGRRDR